MSELTITALRFGFLLLLWVLIFSIVAAMRRGWLIGVAETAMRPDGHVAVSATRTIQPVASSNRA